MNKREASDYAESSGTIKKVKSFPSLSINPDYLHDEYKNQLSTCWRFAAHNIHHDSAVLCQLRGAYGIRVIF